VATRWQQKLRREAKPRGSIQTRSRLIKPKSPSARRRRKGREQLDKLEHWFEPSSADPGRRSLTSLPLWKIFAAVVGQSG
jgi:hypothetical protein